MSERATSGANTTGTCWVGMRCAPSLRRVRLAASFPIASGDSRSPIRRAPDHQLSPETYLGSARAQYFSGKEPLADGTHTYAFGTLHPGNAEFSLSGTWTVHDEELTAGPGAQLRLNFLAAKVYLDVGGSGTVTSTVDGRTTPFDVRGAPDIYTVYSGPLKIKPLVLHVTPGLQLYSFTFG